MAKIGILLTNTGTPDAATPNAVRRYLREFLSDPRVVQLPRMLWLPLLYGLVLPLRSKRSAKLYQKIWTASGSPLRVHMQTLVEKLQTQLSANFAQNIFVELGMNYGNPSIESGLKKLRKRDIDQLIIFPLYPQYSNATVASSFDRAIYELKKIPSLPQLTFLHHYAVFPDYIEALAASVRRHRIQNENGEHLLISFHGVPEHFTRAGDPYQYQCEQTAVLLSNALGLTSDQWSLCYQSRFGRTKWIGPATTELLTSLAKRGLKHVDIICPGFAVDCLETLEEIQLQGQLTFLQSGGVSLEYIPALNDSEDHIRALVKFIQTKIST